MDVAVLLAERHSSGRRTLVSLATDAGVKFSGVICRATVTTGPFAGEQLKHKLLSTKPA
jgi:hypothetical protein